MPSKKILIALSLLIVGIAFASWYKFSGGVNDENKVSNQNIFTATTSNMMDSAIAQKDSDNDGLPDWEEALYGTNPNLADTDGDGTPDGKEVALGRNPLVKGPNDFIVSKNNKNATSTDKENLTLTDTFARNLFTQYMYTQQSGVQVTADNASEIATDYLKNAPLPDVAAKQYTAKDIVLINTDKASLKAYDDTITAIIKENWPPNAKNEYVVLQQVFVNSSDNKTAAKTMDELAYIISGYQTILNEATTIVVPKLAISLHLNVINSLSTYIETLKMIKLSFTDPISGLVGINEFETNKSNFLFSLANLRMYLINSLK